MTPLEFGVIAVVVVIATALQGSIGFGLGMLTAPVIGLIEPELLPSIVIILAIVVTALVVVRERASLDVRGAGWALAGRVPGSLAGALLVAQLSAQALAWLVGGVVLLGVVMAFVGWMPRPTRTGLVLAGAASGVMGTSTSIGGAPMALIWQRSSGAELRGTMAGFFLVGSSISLVFLALVGSVTLATVVTAVWLLPAVVLGYVLSRYTSRMLTKERLRLTALAASAFGAVLLIGTQLI